MWTELNCALLVAAGLAVESDMTAALKNQNNC